MTYRAAVSLGSNLGDRLTLLRGAVRDLRRLGTVEAVSSLYETAPVGGPQQGPYLNAVVALTTGLTPADLLTQLHRLEAAAGRLRRERWGPRLLDLDLIAVVDQEGDCVEVASEDLTLPHPRARERRFVLEPLAEIWRGARVAGTATAGDLLGSVADQEVERLGGDWVEPRMGTARSLLAIQAVVLGTYGRVLVATWARPRAGPSAVAGGVLAAAGSGLAVWGATCLGPNLSPYPEPRPGTTLVDEGPYRFLRHPIYSGLVACLAGVALAARSWPAVLAAAATAGFYRFKAEYEESRLRPAVPGYAAYQRRVRGRMLPMTKAST